MLEDLISKRSDEQYHVVFLHNKLRKRSEDRYLIDAALALSRYGHKITIITSQHNPKNCFEEVTPTGHFSVLFCGWWLPNSICGFFSERLAKIKSAWMAGRMIFHPPAPRPKVLVLDIDPIALFFFAKMSKYKTIYLFHFPQLDGVEKFQQNMQLTPDLLTAISIKYANEIIVETDCLNKLMYKSFANLPVNVKTFTPCVDTGTWLEEPIDINRILPDLPPDCQLFVCFGEYRKRSNFKLALEGFDYMYEHLEDRYKNRIHLVIAGHCNTKDVSQQIHYLRLLERVKEKMFASQVTLLRQLPTIHKKTLILNCAAVLCTVKHDVYPSALTATMGLGRAIIGVNSGFAVEALTHRISAILVEPSHEKFGQAMMKLVKHTPIQGYLGDMAKEIFRQKYDFGSFSWRFNGMLQKLQNGDIKKDD